MNYDPRALRSRAETHLWDAVQAYELGRTSNGAPKRILLRLADKEAALVSRVMSKDGSKAGQELRAAALLVSARVACERGEADIAINLLVAAATFQDFESAPKYDATLADIALELSRCYTFLGDVYHSTRFAIESTERTEPSRWDATVVATVVNALIAGRRDEDARRVLVDHREILSSPPARAYSSLLRQVCGADEAQLDEAIAAQRVVVDWDPEAAVQATLYVVQSCTAAGRADDASDALRRLIAGLERHARSPWLVARMRYRLGAISLATGDAHAALSDALPAWAILDELRYRIGSQRHRTLYQRSLADVTAVAMRAATEIRDWRLLAELIEASKLQAGSEVVGNPAQLDQLLAEGQLPECDNPYQPGEDGRRWVAVPEPYNEALNDLRSSYHFLAPPADIWIDGTSRLAEVRQSLIASMPYLMKERTRIDAEHVLQRVCPDNYYWWATAVMHRSVYWSGYSNSRRAFMGGVITVVPGTDLATALTACLRHHKRDSTLLDRSSPVKDLSGALLVADSHAEADITVSLSALLPEDLRNMAEQAPPAANLLLSVAPDLTVVPWPVVRIAGDSGPRRVIEQYTLRHLPALSALHGNDPVLTIGGNPLPFVLSCDYLSAHDNREPKSADVQLGSPVQAAAHHGIDVATTLNLVRAMRHQRPGRAGISFIRCHYAPNEDAPTHVNEGHESLLEAARERASRDYSEDPSTSGLALHDGVLPAGFLCVRDKATERPIVGLSSHVVLSCCSSVGVRRFNGGESLGLTASCLLGGARCVVATAVDIPDLPFTDELDDLLIDSLRFSLDHFTTLRELQLYLLERWRRPHTTPNAVDGPFPIVWAYYQAFGYQ